MRTFPLLLLMILVTGCGGRDLPVGPSGPPGIAFDLVIPSNTTPADYFGVSGTSIRTELVPVGNDTVPDYVESSVIGYYAQFTSLPGVTAPIRVLINGDSLGRHHGTDTFRLETATSLAGLVGDNVWKISTGGADTSFTAPALGSLDSIRPLYEKEAIRGDIAMNLRWKPGAGAGIMLTWTLTGSDYVYTRVIPDNGSYVIPADEIRKLRGEGEVRMIRFRTSTFSYNGHSLLLTRLAQRVYDVTIP